MNNIDRLSTLAGIINEEDNAWVSSTKKLEQAFDLLRSLPLGEWVKTTEVHKRMLARGHQIDLRSTQRYLNGYAKFFGIQRQPSTDGSRDFEWKRTSPLRID